MKIGFFDSGLGGLIVLKAVARALPQYEYEFYGDTANLPYGDKTEEQIYELTKQGITHLFNRDCLLVIVACNTASAETLRKLQDGFIRESYPDRRVLGVIIPTVETVVEEGLKNTLLIATKRTVDSGKYEREFEKLSNRPALYSIATPALVPLIELGEREAALTEAKNVIDTRAGEIDSVILGCTHYCLLKEELRKYFEPKNTKIISQDEIIPEKLSLYLHNHPEIEERLERGEKRNIFLTDSSSRYDAVIAELLGGSFIGD